MPHIREMREKPQDPPEPSPAASPKTPQLATPKPREIDGPKGPEPTRYGDWEYSGRCTDF